MNESLKISIVTPSFNLGKYVKRAIDSVLSQNYDNFEYYVIDGKSRDNTIEILKSYDDPRLKWISEPDGGQTNAINKGLKLCTGDIFAWLNADDYYEEHCFSKVANAFIDNPAVGVVYGNCYDDFNDHRELRKPPRHISLNYTLNYGNVIYGPASFYNLSLIKQVGLFDETIKYWMDYDMYLRLMKISDFYYIDENLSNFMVREGQKSNDLDKRVYNNFLKEAYYVSIKNGGKKLNPLFFSCYPEPIRRVHEVFWSKLYSTNTMY